MSAKLVVTIIVGLIRVYKSLISPLFPNTCRFHPTCSTYAIDALSKYGLLKGLFLSAKRVVKCNPWHPGGFDPLP